MSHPTALLIGTLAASALLTAVFGYFIDFYSPTFSILREFLQSFFVYVPLALVIFFDSETLFPLLIKSSIVFAVAGTILQQIGKNTTGKVGTIITILGDDIVRVTGYLLAAAVIAKIKSRG